MCPRLFVLLASAAMAAFIAVSGEAQERADAAASPFTVRTSIKATGLVSRYSFVPELFPEPTTGESMFRVRVEPQLKTRDHIVFTVAYEQRLYFTSGAGRVPAITILPSQTVAPYRVRPLDWSLGAASNRSWRHEIDRANAQLHTGRAEVTLGRQAIGWGRGVMFGAVDLFAPFSPLEADREWRRGVDAARSDIRLTDRTSIDLVGAFGPSLDTSAFAARFRGYAAALDLEVMAGRRARDLFGGVTTSAPVGDAELHGELAAFRVPDDVRAVNRGVVWKAIAGGSYRFPIGSGVLAFVEYHYSGFGAENPEQIPALLATPAFVERYIRGDMQILSRHALAMMGSYEPSPEVSWSAQWLHNPRDRSGVVAPNLTYTFSDAVSIAGTVYLPYGRLPEAGRLRSEYGATPISGLVQLRLYF